METKIRQKLEEIEKKYNVQVIYAVESGSRTWGLASEDSGWDVRFIYIHPLEWYLQPKKKDRDTIEWISDDRVWDMIGWDLRKSLLNKSNPSLVEWLYSNIVYIDIKGSGDVLRYLFQKAMSLTRCMYYYRSIAHENWKQQFDGKTEGKLKKYFYIIRSILMMQLILKETKLFTTIDFEEVLNLCVKYIPKEVDQNIRRLLEIKRNGSSESDIVVRITEIDNWIVKELQTDIPKIQYTPIDNMVLSQYLHSFAKAAFPFPDFNHLINPCHYSFQDLLEATRRNNQVEILYDKAGWYWHDILTQKYLEK